MTGLSKNAATKADVVKTWVDKLNTSTLRILNSINEIKNNPNSFAQAPQFVKFVDGSLGFIRTSIEDKIINYLKNVKKFSGNHPLVRGSNGVIRICDRTIALLEAAVDAQEELIEAQEEEDANAEMLAVTASDAWDKSIEAVETLQNQIKILGQNLLREFSPGDFTPPQSPQGQQPGPIASPMLPTSPAMQPRLPTTPAAPSSTTSVQANPEQINNIINYLNKSVYYLAASIKPIQEKVYTPEQWNYYSVIISFCNAMKDYCTQIKQTNLADSFNYASQSLLQVKSSPESAAQLLPQVAYHISAALKALQSQPASQALSGSQTGQQEQATTQAVPAANTLEQAKTGYLKVLKFAASKIEEILNNRKSNEAAINKILNTNKKYDQKSGQITFDRKMDDLVLLNVLKEDVKKFGNIYGYCNQWISKHKNIDQEMNQKIESIQKESYDYFAITNKLKKIWEEKNSISKDEYPDPVTSYVKKFQTTINQYIREAEMPATGKILNFVENIPSKVQQIFSTNQDNSLAFKILAATEHFGQLVVLAKKQSGVATKTNPSLWSRCKSEAKARMGGKHSARAMQLAVKLYKQRGGGYRGKKPTAKTNKMKKWTKQKWMYLSDFKKKKKKDKNKLDDHLVEDNYFEGIAFEDENDARGKISYDEKLSLALGTLEQLVRDEGIESLNVEDQIEQAAWEYGYYNKEGKLEEWLKFLGKHYNVDVEKAFKDGVKDGHNLNDTHDAKGRYLPAAKWESLSPKEREATDRKKKQQGKNKQYVANTEKAKVKSKAKYY